MKITITTQVALELLTNHALKHSDKPGDKYFIKAYSNVIKELVDKEVPMKPNSRDTLNGNCANCNQTIHKHVHRYCDNCGQRIDWREEA